MISSLSKFERELFLPSPFVEDLGEGSFSGTGRAEEEIHDRKLAIDLSELFCRLEDFSFFNSLSKNKFFHVTRE